MVVDRRRQVSRNARILAPPGEVLLFAAPRPKRSRAVKDERLGAARIETVRALRGHLDLKRVFARLAELEINDVLVEAGAKLSGALLRAGLVDEWLVYVAPMLLGKDARPLAALPRFASIKAAPKFALLESVVVGSDVRLRLKPAEALAKRTAKRK